MAEKINAGFRRRNAAVGKFVFCFNNRKKKYFSACNDIRIFTAFLLLDKLMKLYEIR